MKLLNKSVVTCVVVFLMSFHFANPTHAASNKDSELAQNEPESRPWVIQPLPLVKPIQIDTLQILFDEAESLYQSKRFAQASDALRQLLELEPRLSSAWFRLANTWQQEGKMDWATPAYLAATRTDAVVLPRQPTNIAVKALTNLANFHLNAAQDAVDKLEAGFSSSEFPVQDLTHRIKNIKAASQQRSSNSITAANPQQGRSLKAKQKVQTNQRPINQKLTNTDSRVQLILGQVN
jgi:tetratricopeptide (TPR) repeat protein